MDHKLWLRRRQYPAAAESHGLPVCVWTARQGVSFLQLLDDTRHQLALGYVEQKRLSITEIAFMLGFSDVSNFNRAFRRWTGRAPSEYRLVPH